MCQMIQEMGNDKTNDYFNKLAEKIEKNPPTDMNKGYEALMNDLVDLSSEAYDHEFDDFRNTKYPAPKVELRRRLLEMAENVVNGKYDN